MPELRNNHRMSCLFLHLSPLRCRINKATAEELPSACETCPEYKGRPRGLGDIVAKVAETTGVATVVKAVVGEGCGCGQRRAALNRAVPFREGAD